MRALHGRKADFMATVTTFLGVSILVFLLGFQLGSYYQVAKGLNIGDKQFTLFSAYSRAEEALFYVDESSGIALEQASSEAAAMGGTANPACGTASGIALWKDGKKECYPSTEDNRAALAQSFTPQLSKYLAAYKALKIPADYSYEFKEGNIIGMAKQDTAISGELAKTDSKDTYSYKFRASFKHPMPYSDEYDAIKAKARQIASSCEGKNGFSGCIKSFDGPAAGGLQLDVNCLGPPDETERLVLICARNGKTEYRFGLRLE